MTKELDSFSKRALDEASPDLTSICSRLWNGDDEEDVEEDDVDDDASPDDDASEVSSTAFTRGSVLLCAPDPTRVREDE